MFDELSWLLGRFGLGFGLWGFGCVLFWVGWFGRLLFRGYLNGLVGGISLGVLLLDLSLLWSILTHDTPATYTFFAVNSAAAVVISTSTFLTPTHFI